MDTIVEISFVGLLEFLKAAKRLIQTVGIRIPNRMTINRHLINKTSSNLKVIHQKPYLILQSYFTDR